MTRLPPQWSVVLAQQRAPWKTHGFLCVGDVHFVPVECKYVVFDKRPMDLDYELKVLQGHADQQLNPMTIILCSEPRSKVQ